MKTLQDIYNKIKPGDIILMQETKDGIPTKPVLIIVVGIDIWDMACAIYYTKYKDFDKITAKSIQDYGDNAPDVYDFGEWMEYWIILGHWHSMPKFKKLLKSYRNKKT